MVDMPQKSIKPNHTYLIHMYKEDFFWTSPEGNTPQSTCCTTTYLPSRKLSKLDEPDMQDTAEEVGTSSLLMFSHGQRQAKAVRTYILQLCEDMECNPEDLLEAMNNREEWRERVRDDDDDKEDLALNIPEWFICHKTKPNQVTYILYIYICIKKIWH